MKERKGETDRAFGILSREGDDSLFPRYLTARSLSSDVRPVASLCARFRAIRRVIVCIANVQPTPPTVRHTGERRRSVQRFTVKSAACASSMLYRGPRLG